MKFVLGTWLVSADYQIANFDIIKKFFIKYIPTSKSEALEDMKKLLTNENKLKALEDELFSVKTFIPLAGMIKRIQNSKISMEDQLKIMIEARTLLYSTSVYKKFKDTISGNPDLKTYTCNSVGLVARLRRKYAPLTSVSVERSFSKFNAFYRNNRTHMLTENIVNHIIVNYNMNIKGFK